MKRPLVTGWMAGFCFLLLILDAKTAFIGAMEGITLCVQALIPSLFPFFVLSMLLTSSLTGQRLPFLAPLGRLCGMPRGSESLLLVGLLGGYPVGAQSVAQAYKEGQLSREDAQRLMGFCCNAGPAFLFGIVAGKFASVGTAWALWGIHILSALITGMLLRGKSKETAVLTQRSPLTLPQALERTVKVMATVCGWVILFRIIIAFFSRWFLWLFPGWVQTLLTGLTELSNGCCDLAAIRCDGQRFVVASVMLAFGGLCVMMQTVSVTGNLGTGLYFPGKGMQALLSVSLAGGAQYFLFPAEGHFSALPVIAASCIGFVILHSCLKKPKKRVAFPGKLVYNQEKETLEVSVCSFGSGSKNLAPTASSARS